MAAPTTIARGGNGEPLADTVSYDGYIIQPAPKHDGQQWNVAGVITRKDAPDAGEHSFIRADTYTSKEEADKWSVHKAKQIIKEQGDRLIPKS